MPVITEEFRTRMAGARLFHAEDVTVGVENEWQVCVIGDVEHIDLAQTILQSKHYRNLVRRTQSGDVPAQSLRALDAWLQHNSSRIWENSWVRLPYRLLNAAARACLDHDLLADKSRPEAGQRRDTARFLITQHGESWLRIPVSYLLKLVLAQVAEGADPLVRNTALAIQDCFLNDNTSPEICSFYPVRLDREPQAGAAVAREVQRRFLLTQLLTAYANQALGLRDHGQEVQVYSSPHTPWRQKQLNRLIPDAFYRELFMSPCLSGWDDGEAKYRYMHLCHEVLSRSQLNAVRKMKEAGIIQNNLVILPSLSNTGLANNGVHISIGSRCLTRWMAEPAHPFKAADEKNIGDLATKMIEYFLPLFVGTYSASPHKLEFYDFHPETILGFLPHELDHTHLRMLWRRWKKKGRFKVFGRALTPFGPEWIDRLLNRLFGFKGDFVPDFRLLDYPVALQSTAESPALDGCLGNDQRLLADLAEQGVFDARMPVYRLWRLRDYARMKFSGFEARYYSQFGDTATDMADAVCLQVLITALAYRTIGAGLLNHADIPDSTEVESERRQILFGAAAGIPTFYIRRDTPCAFMQSLLAKVARTRPSRRYPACIRVRADEYRKALVKVLREDGADLIRELNAGRVLDDLEKRLQPGNGRNVAVRMSDEIRESLGGNSIARTRGDAFNQAAEQYYRETLRHRETGLALDVMASDIAALQAAAANDPRLRAALAAVCGGRDGTALFSEMKQGILDGTLKQDPLGQMIHLLLLIIDREMNLNK